MVTDDCSERQFVLINRLDKIVVQSFCCYKVDKLPAVYNIAKMNNVFNTMLFEVRKEYFLVKLCNKVCEYRTVASTSESAYQ
jgi:hypothetical protein